MKTSDLADDLMLMTVHEFIRQKNRPYSTCSLFDLEEFFSRVPPKIILSKCRALIRRGLMSGCDCGCRGDFELTDKGRAFLHESGWFPT